MWIFHAVHCSDVLTQEFIEEVENVLPRGARLLPGHLSKVGCTVVHVHPVNAFGQEGQHALKKK